MNPETYCGASDEHVHFNNQKLSNGEPIKLFGIDGPDERTIWLDMKNCSGTLDSVSFSLLPNLDYISMENCNFDQCSKIFAPLEKLNSVRIEKGTCPLDFETFEDNNSITSLSLQDIKIPTNSFLRNLNKLDSISFDTCTFDTLNKDLFSELNALKGLSISNCKINKVDSNVFDEIIQLEGLNIRDSEIKEIDFNIFKQLINLKFLSFHDNKIDKDVGYEIFEQLPSLDTIHFDLDIYKTINFQSMSNLQTVKIGYTNDEEDTEEASQLMDQLNSKGIKTEYVFCGTVDFDDDEMVECC